MAAKDRKYLEETLKTLQKNITTRSNSIDDSKRKVDTLMPKLDFYYKNIDKYKKQLLNIKKSGISDIIEYKQILKFIDDNETVIDTCKQQLYLNLDAINKLYRDIEKLKVECEEIKQNLKTWGNVTNLKKLKK